MKKLFVAGSLLSALSCSSCVARGAQVRVARGLRPIEDLCVGDELICVDPDSGEQLAAPLVAIRSAKRECVRIVAGGLELILTSDHPVYCPERREWAPAGDWVLGKRTQLLAVTLEAIEPVRVSEVFRYAGIHEVFDLSVDHPLHNFVANGVLVHNKKPLPPSCLLPDGGRERQGTECTCANGNPGQLSCDAEGLGPLCVSCSAEEDAGSKDGG